MLDLKYWSFGCLVDPPLPPSGHPGPKCVKVKACHGALGGPFFDHFFASILDSILDSFWIRFGLVLDLFWIPFGSSNRVKLGQECVLSGNFFENVDFHADLRFPMFFCFFDSRMGPKIASRPVQYGSKSDKKVTHFLS